MKHIGFVVGVALVALGCGNKDGGKTEGSAAATPPSTAPSAAAPVAVTPPPPAAAAPAPCSLITADEVSAIFKKKLVAQANGSSCTYSLDPAEAQAQIQKLQSGGAMGMIKNGKVEMPTLDQLGVELHFERSDETEDAVKKVYASIGGAVGSAEAATGVDKVQKGLNAKDVIAAGKDVPGVGDWAFSTNVMTAMNIRGRIFETKKGGWRMTISVTVSPDPGADKLDDEIASVAKTALTKLN